jgi:murein DD-endopeptidase MepM/ murein hydrolase activator NlpD
MRLILSLPALALFVSCATPTAAPVRTPSRLTEAVTTASSSQSQDMEWTAPLPLDRVTKKPFGIRIDPNNSPVSPERFRGYHTGADFETLQGETNVFVPALCSGTVLVRKWVSGYGGVVVERCALASETVTLLYGHLRLSSVNVSVGERLSAGAAIGMLGSAYSEETDGERRHLHLSVHRGGAVELRGYVQSASELDAWIDPLTVLK